MINSCGQFRRIQYHFKKSSLHTVSLESCKYPAGEVVRGKRVVAATCLQNSHCVEDVKYVVEASKKQGERQFICSRMETIEFVRKNVFQYS